MLLDVKGQMVGPGKSSLAHVALVWPDSRVLSHVSAKFVGAREFPAASLPGAQVRLLPGVRPHVRLHVRRLVVNFTAARLRTRVDHGGALYGASPTFLWWLLGVGGRCGSTFLLFGGGLIMVVERGGLGGQLLANLSVT